MCDVADLCQYLECQQPDLVKELFLVHGEDRSLNKLSEKLKRKGFKKITIPGLHQEFELT